MGGIAVAGLAGGVAFGPEVHQGTKREVRCVEGNYCWLGGWLWWVGTGLVVLSVEKGNKTGKMLGYQLSENCLVAE
jgi:hypothetical protein